MKTFFSIFVAIAAMLAVAATVTHSINNSTMPNITVSGPITNAAIANALAGGDGSGQMIAITPGSGLSLSGGTLSVSSSGSPFYRSGSTNIASLATSQEVVFSSPVSSTNYSPVVGSLFVLGSVSFSFSGLTTNGFTVNLSSGVVGGGQMNWAVILAN